MITFSKMVHHPFAALPHKRPFLALFWSTPPRSHRAATTSQLRPRCYHLTATTRLRPKYRYDTPLRSRKYDHADTTTQLGPKT